MLSKIQRIFGIGLNYRDHAAEMGKPIPSYPDVFIRPLSSILPVGQPLVLPPNSSKVDYEAELGVLIGSSGKFISPENALTYVAGYCLACDVSVRDFQGHGSQWTAGKMFDGTLPLGPIVSADKISDPQALDIELLINGETLQKSNTSQMIFSVAQIIAYLSECLTLQPGDLIITGTPAGVGVGRKPPRYLKAGDVIITQLQGLGALTVPVLAASTLAKK